MIDGEGEERERRSEPVEMAVPEDGVAFAESLHGASFAMEWRRDPFSKVLFVLHGESRILPRRGDAVAAPSGTIVFLRAGVEHRIEDVTPATLLVLGIGERASAPLRALRDELCPAASAARSLDPRPLARIEAILRRCLQEQSGRGPGSQAAMQAHLTLVLVEVLRAESAPPAPDAEARVREAWREIRAKSWEDWDVDGAARLAGLSRRRFTELFRKATGRSFLDALTEDRLERFHAVRAAGRLSLLSCVFECGFRDPSNFYRVYRKRFGTSPKGVRSDAADGGRGRRV